MFNVLSNNEKQFILNNLKSEFREENRKLTEFRALKFEKLKYDGQVMVHLGNTKIFSQVFAKLISPEIDRPSEGIILFNVDTSHLKQNSEYTSNIDELSDIRIKLNNLLEKSLKDSKAFDTLSLCVVPKRLVWKIIVDISVINNDGNLYDSTMLAVLASWMTFKIPFLRKNGANVEFNQMINLTALHIPLSITYGLFDNNTKFLVDPNLREEKCLDGIIIISANKFDEICYLHSYSSVKVDRDIVDDLVQLTKETIGEIYQKLKSFSEDCKRNTTNQESFGKDVIMNESTKQTINYSDSIKKNEKKGKNITKIYEIK